MAHGTGRHDRDDVATGTWNCLVYLAAACYLVFCTTCFYASWSLRNVSMDRAWMRALTGHPIVERVFGGRSHRRTVGAASVPAPTEPVQPIQPADFSATYSGQVETVDAASTHPAAALVTGALVSDFSSNFSDNDFVPETTFQGFRQGYIFKNVPTLTFQNFRFYGGRKIPRKEGQFSCVAFQHYICPRQLSSTRNSLQTQLILLQMIDP